MPGPHPTDRDLAALLDERLDAVTADAVRAHVRECARCQLRVGAAGDVLVPGTVRAPAGNSVTILEETATAVPARGDVWRLAWDSIVLLAVIWRVDADRAAVLPIVDTADADEWCALLAGTDTGGLGALAVSVALETAVPWAVLDARVAQLAAISTLESLRGAYRTGSETGAHRGDAVVSPLDERLVGLDELAEQLNELANAVWAPASATAATTALEFDPLVDAGIAVNRALAIIRGATPTDDEADLIEAATGSRPAGRPIDDDLRRKIDLPRRKAAIRARAGANRRSEAAERLALARDAQPELAAARGTQHGAAPDYDTILDRLLGA